MKTQLLLSVLLVAAALAGCASNDDGDHEDNMSVTTPAATSPASGTPTTTTPGVTPGNTSTNETPGTPPAICANAQGTTSNATLQGYPLLAFTIGAPTGTDPCTAITGPTNATAGWNAIQLTANAMGGFIMPMTHIGTHGLQEFAAAQETGEEPEWATAVGGIGGVGGPAPGANATVVLDLEAGTYVLTLVNVVDPTAPVIIRTLTVTNGTNATSTATAPVANVTIRLFDFGFDVPANLSAGPQMVRFFNNGTQPHEAPLIAFAPGKNMTDFVNFFAPGAEPQGPPPGGLAGGVNVLSPGEEAYAWLDLAAGNYGFICFVESPEHEGAPHFALGMRHEFSVTSA